MGGRCGSTQARGFSLVEVVVALAVFVGLALVCLALVRSARDASLEGRRMSATTRLAAAKLDQLLAASWHVETDAGGVWRAATDAQTAFASGRLGSGGVGIRPGPRTSAWDTSAGYVDFLDADERFVAGGTGVPAGAAYVRRWSISYPPGLSPDIVVFEVRVTAVPTDTSTVRPRGPSEARLVGAKIRSVR
ncbi:MAG: prepilin-type N-terminal cleavage/methylation domain-containing protein [Vicinamibacterales bacterium]